MQQVSASQSEDSSQLVPTKTRSKDAVFEEIKRICTLGANARDTAVQELSRSTGLKTSQIGDVMVYLAAREESDASFTLAIFMDRLRPAVRGRTQKH